MGILETSAGVSLRLFNRPQELLDKDYDNDDHNRHRLGGQWKQHCPRFRQQSRANLAKRRQKEIGLLKRLSIILGENTPETRRRYQEMEKIYGRNTAIRCEFSPYEVRRLLGR